MSPCRDPNGSATRPYLPWLPARPRRAPSPSAAPPCSSPHHDHGQHQQPAPSLQPAGAHPRGGCVGGRKPLWRRRAYAHARPPAYTPFLVLPVWHQPAAGRGLQVGMCCFQPHADAAWKAKRGRWCPPVGGIDALAAPRPRHWSIRPGLACQGSVHTCILHTVAHTHTHAVETHSGTRARAHARTLARVPHPHARTCTRAQAACS